MEIIVKKKCVNTITDGNQEGKRREYENLLAKNVTVSECLCEQAPLPIFSRRATATTTAANHPEPRRG
jgi:hypothetical protein